MAKKGVLLLNIGSPKSYEIKDVKKYLNTFLMDKDVINLPFVFRWPLVHLLIVPRRAPFSAENYKKVWLQGEGSPLTVYTQKFANRLQKDLGSDYLVKVGMRYAEPGIEKALREFEESGVETIILAPLFPQYAEATTESSLKEVDRLAGRLGIDIPTESLPPFFDEKAFIDPTVRIIQETLGDEKPDHYLFSFHGLPESHIRKVPGCLRSEDCCFEENACAKNCYRAQCFESATQIAESLGLLDSHWSVSFQSRLGRGEWLKPATDHSLEILAQTGKKKVAVICPSFVADCIETLEEIGIGGQETFKEHGGQEYRLIPCLNDDKEWTSKFAGLIRELKIVTAESR
ncbi:ferrochelatase [Bdellovibrio sp. BCCA]|uniref:ferrochelatase n=1 Tax=Bdellovibrio sp. BCCA TaxID=3136281 RepID=UPI0030F13B8B